MSDGKSFAGQIVNKFATLKDRIIMFKGRMLWLRFELAQGLENEDKKVWTGA